MNRFKGIINSWSVENNVSQLPKPPLGIMPHFVWLDIRKSRLMDAIDRYTNEGLPISKDRREELEMLKSLTEFNSKKQCNHAYDISKETADECMLNRVCYLCGRAEEVGDIKRLIVSEEFAPHLQIINGGTGGVCMCNTVVYDHWKICPVCCKKLIWK